MSSRAAERAVTRRLDMSRTPVGLALALVVASAGWIAVDGMRGLEVRGQLRNDVAAVRELARAGTPLAVLNWVDSANIAAHGQAWFSLRRSDGTAVSGDLDIPARPAAGGHTLRLTASDAGLDATGAIIAQTVAAPPAFVVQAARRDPSPGLLHWSVLAGSLVLLAALLALRARAAQRLGDIQAARVAGIVDILRRTRAGEPGLRPPMPDASTSRDDLDEIAAHLSALLDEVDRNMDQVQSWTARAAHELRGRIAKLPATSLRAKAAIDDTLAMLDALMDLAHVGGSVGRSAGLIDAGAMLRGLAEVFSPAAEDAGVRIMVQADAAPLLGERVLLEQAVGNLLSNALRYSPPGSILEVAYRAGPLPELSVRDHGHGPAGDSVAAILAQPPGELDAGGKRIGLRLVEAVAMRHGGHLRIENARPGMRITIVLGPQSRDAA